MLLLQLNVHNYCIYKQRWPNETREHLVVNS